ncbi:unnamed protein product [Rhizoctonia solani]|uniref:40S ribosomal protein S9 n=1 Tax=Rhizoctonia solani TaxID=456999 RepID=A0A8H2XCB0_9AGAM|nr:unnamed protein product [Rhizoctonia solani]
MGYNPLPPAIRLGKPGVPSSVRDPRGPPSPLAGRFDAALVFTGEYGLRTKRETWRISLVWSKILRAVCELLKLGTKDPKHIFEGNALVCRLVRIDVLDKTCMRLDYVLALIIAGFLERRLQIQVLAKSIHHTRVLIRQRHIRVGKIIVDVPSFVVRFDSQKHIDFAITSPYGGGRKGRVHRKHAAAASRKNAGGDDEGEE